jgi:2'-5' RNA ligase
MRDIAGMFGRAQRTPFELRIDGLLSFGGRKPRAVVATIPPVTPLMDLQAEHERLLQRLGLEPDRRKYTPHVTLARLRETSSRQVADYLAARGHYRSQPFQVSRFVLFSSRSSTGGGPYIVEAAYPLAANELRRA